MVIDFEDFIGPHSSRHYLIANIITEPELWEERVDEHIRWCIWANRGFCRSNTFFGVKFWFQRIDALKKADDILYALEETDK